MYLQVNLKNSFGGAKVMHWLTMRFHHGSTQCVSRELQVHRELRVQLDLKVIPVLKGLQEQMVLLDLKALREFLGFLDCMRTVTPCT